MAIQIVEEHVSGFKEFMRERGVAGLAIGFVLGSAIQKVVNSLVADIINPLIAILTGRAESFGTLMIGPFAIGDFITSLMGFVILAAIVYLVFKGFGLDRVEIKELKNP